MAEKAKKLFVEAPKIDWSIREKDIIEKTQNEMIPEVTKHEGKKAASKMKNGKAPGLDEVTNEIVKSLINRCPKYFVVF